MGQVVNHIKGCQKISLLKMLDEDNLRILIEVPCFMKKIYNANCTFDRVEMFNHCSLISGAIGPQTAGS